MRKLQRFVALVLSFALCMQLVTFSVYYFEGGQTVFAAESFIYGDLNGDNSLDSTDLTLLKRYLLRKISDFPVEDDLKSADLDGDGEINSTDLTLMKRKILRKLEYFPVEKPTQTPTPTQMPTLPPTPTHPPTLTPTPIPTPTIEVPTVSDYLRPFVNIVTSAQTVQTGSEVTITVYSEDDTEVVKTNLEINGNKHDIDSKGTAVFKPTTAGIYEVKAISEDAYGNVGVATAQIVCIDSSDKTFPQASLTEPADWSAVTGKTTIIGTASDENIVKYVLEYSEKSKNEYVKIAEGNFNVKEGELGELDTSRMKNGLYDLRLTVFDKGGNTRSHAITVLVQSKLKKGVTSLSFEDMTIPAGRLPLTVIRSYSSNDKSTGDFGKGWTINTGIRLYKSCTDGDNWKINKGVVYSIEETKPHLIIVTYPDGTMDKFQMMLDPNPFQPTSVYQGRMIYKPVGETTSSLEPISSNICYAADIGFGFGVYSDLFEGTKYNPTRYRLTTKEGDVLVFNASGMLESYSDSNKNTVKVTSGGLTHSNKKSLKFTKDSKGRITKITCNEGNSYEYTYDKYGDLVSVKDPLGNVTKYIYDENHDLIDVIDPRGIRITRNEYDSYGRLKAVYDAGGNKATYEFNDAAGIEIITDRLGNKTILEYDENENLVKLTDALGNSTTFTYDKDGRMLTRSDPLNSYANIYYNHKGEIVGEIKDTGSSGSNGSVDEEIDESRRGKKDSLGNTVEFTFNSQGKILTAKDIAGNITTNIYDAAGNLTQTIDPLSYSTSIGYDGKGNVTSITDQLGKKVQYNYDDKGNLISQIDDTGIIMNFGYDENGRCVSKTVTLNTPEGVKTVTSRDIYDSMGRVVQSIDGKGGISKVEYNSIGEISAYIDKLSQRTEYFYDIYGNLSTIRYPDGTTESFTYNEEGWNITATDREGKTTKFDYDALGRVIEVIYPDKSVKKIEYDAKGNITRVTDPNGNYTTYGYDAMGRNTTIRDMLGNVTTFVYSNSINPYIMIDAKGREYKYTYDANGRRTMTTFPDGTTYCVSYDGAGNVISETDQAGNTTTYSYDYAGRLKSITDAMDNTWEYEYDALGNLVKVTDPNLNETLYEYDELGRLIKRTLPMGMSETVEYDAEGNVIATTDFSGNTIKYSYANGRLVEKKCPDGSTIRFEYYNGGLIKSVTDSSGTTTYQYNDTYGLISRTNPDGSTVKYSYDKVGNRTEVITKAGTTKYVYDELNRVKKAISVDGGETVYTYDEVGNRISLTYPNGVKAKYTYDDLNRLVKVENIGSGGRILSSYEYTLGPSGNRTKVVESTGRTVDYEYDELYRLVKETVTETDGSKRYISYTYDAVGNRLTKDDNGTKTVYTYDNNYRLIKEGNINYSYDNNGNLVRKVEGQTTTQYEYDCDNRLVKVSTTNINGITTEEYLYDWQGNRIQKRTNEVFVINYIVDSNRWLSRVIEERDGNGNLLVYYTIGDEEIISQTRGTKTSYYLYDGHGSTRELTDEAGNITDTYPYDAFGNLLKKTGNTENSYLYAGEQFDPNTGFYYLRARYMDPAIGRFITMDSFAGSIYDPVSLHKYLYANASPVNFKDPTGYSSLSEMLNSINLQGIIGSVQNTLLPLLKCLLKSAIKNAIRGAIRGAFYSSIDAALRGDSIIDGAINGAVYGALFGALATFDTIRDILMVVGLGTGAYGVKKALDEGNYLLAAWRAYSVYSALKAIKKGLFDSKACFTEGTLILTADGYKEIQDIRVGDEVYSQNPKTGEKGLKRVINVFVREVDVLIHIKAGEEDIETTKFHPFWIEGKGWVEAEDVKPGDRLVLYSGETLGVSEVYQEYLQSPVKVYNFEVEDWHTYFVSEQDVFVHNAEGYTSSSNGSGNNGANGKGKNIVGTDFNEIKPTQTEINPQKVQSYADKLQAGENVKPIEVVNVNGKGKYIIEGHHRYVASQQTGIPVEVIETQGDGPIGMPNWSLTEWLEWDGFDWIYNQ